jgi:hypothetical protein
MTRNKKDKPATTGDQAKLFDLFNLGKVVVMEEPSPAPALPEGWAQEDINFLLRELEGGPLLVADTSLGIPTIHSNFGAEVVHLGFGLMRVKTAEYALFFDAGGAMQRTPSGKGWTRLKIEGAYQYDLQSVREKLRSYLPEDNADRGDGPNPSDSPCDTDLEEPDGKHIKPGTVEDQAGEFMRSLGQFCGTAEWHRHPAPCPHIVLLTDGARFVAEHGGEDGGTAYWLFDAIASYQGEAALKRIPFQVWTLSVHPLRHASLVCTDGNDRELVRQEIEFTDFLPVGELTLYASVEDQPDISPQRKTMIVLLPSEY